MALALYSENAGLQKNSRVKKQGRMALVGPQNGGQSILVVMVESKCFATGKLSMVTFLSNLNRQHLVPWQQSQKTRSEVLFL
jgi:hypothetical protein